MNSSPAREPTPEAAPRRGLFGKYLVSFALLASAALIVNVLVDSWFSFQEQKRLLTAVQNEKAGSAAAAIGSFVEGIENQMGWLSARVPGVSSAEDPRIDAIRLLRLSPAIAEVAELDATGHERLRVSRRAVDAVGSGKDLSQSPAFRGAKDNGVYHGPVEFYRETEPFMTIAVANVGWGSGVVVADVNLRFIWDVVSNLEVGEGGKSYVLDAGGRLIAHADLWPALRNMDLSDKPEVRAALSGVASPPDGLLINNLYGQRTLSVFAPVKPLGWLVFVERPLGEAYAPIYRSIARSLLIFAILLACAIAAAWLLSRRMILPIQELAHGAARIGGGDLTQRLAIRTNDEFQTLGEQFNQMAEQLSDSYASLERKVAERTAELAKARDHALQEHADAQRARQAAEQANEAKSRFLAVVSHELRTPLNGVIGVLQLLNDGKLNDAQAHQLRIASASGDTLLALIDTILEYARLEAGTEALEQRDFQLQQSIAATIDLMRPLAEAKKLDVVVASDISSATTVHGDPVRLNRVLLNLLGNAIKFTEQGQIAVTASARQSNGEVLLDVAVRDSGIGIAPAMQQRIFEDFVQADDSIARRFGGTGLGLAISRRLARLMGGDLLVESVAGAGSTFRLSVPLAFAENAPVAARNVTQERALAVLLVDDDPVNRDVGAALLRRLGHRPTVVGDGSAAVELAGREAFDAVLMDLHMPDMDGVAAVEQMRRRLGDAMPHVVMLTADVSEQSRQRFVSSGIDTFLGKPLLLEALRIALRPRFGQASAASAAPGTPDTLIDMQFLGEQRTLLGAERLRKLRQLFEETSDAVARAMRSSAAADDGAAVRKAAHQLGGGASSLALAFLSSGCQQLETHALSMSREELQAAVADLAALREASLAAFDVGLDQIEDASAPVL
jgi:signal transduction histidine kinase/DNA-binding response OmpR family regulator